VVSAMILVLVGVVALCPSMGCPRTAPSRAKAGSCCHKPQKQPARCPPKTVPGCPYSILEKSKTNPVVANANGVCSLVRTGPGAAVPCAGLAADTPRRLVDASGLFLRNRVLLI